MKKVFEKTKNSEESISYAENRSRNRAAKSFHVNVWMGVLVFTLESKWLLRGEKGPKANEISKSAIIEQISSF